MTSATHERASDRCAEALITYEKMTGKRYDIVVMVQGDEPMITKSMIKESLIPLISDCSVEVVNLIAKIRETSDLYDPNCIKVVVDCNSDALYLSRNVIPSNTSGSDFIHYRQVCVIPFRRESLIEFNSLQPTPLELAESVDMLRLIENGRKVRMVEITEISYPVDCPKDLERVSRILGNCVL
jgi:3-deoxy-manno-octulosonate cytidylyltransferase (CMP-KDO synthetase)